VPPISRTTQHAQMVMKHSNDTVCLHILLSRNID
jgi:hypothetical protein